MTRKSLYKAIFSLVAGWLLFFALSQYAQGYILEILLQEPVEFWIHNIKITLDLNYAHPVLRITSFYNTENSPLGTENESPPDSPELRLLNNIRKLMRQLRISSLDLELMSAAPVPYSITYVDQSYSPHKARTASWRDDSSGGQSMPVPDSRDVCVRHRCVSSNLMLMVSFHYGDVLTRIPLQFLFSRQPRPVSWLWSEDFFCSVYQNPECAVQQYFYLDPLGLNVLTAIHELFKNFSNFPALHAALANSQAFSSSPISPVLLGMPQKITADQFPVLDIPVASSATQSQSATTFNSGRILYSLHLPPMEGRSNGQLRINTQIQPTLTQLLSLPFNSLPPVFVAGLFIVVVVAFLATLSGI